jgi:hypothetical protein
VVQGATDPYSVTLYLEQNYNKPFGTWKLAPGMRMLKLPIIKSPQSILVGSSVGVILFHDWDFRSEFLVLHHADRMEGNTPVNPEYALVTRTHFPNSSPLMFPNPKFISPRCSLIIYRNDIRDWLGADLERGKYPCYRYSGKCSYQFYPLPEKASERAIIYQKIPYGKGPYTLGLIPGISDSYCPWCSSSPNLREIDVTVTGASGGNTKFPILNSTSTSYELDKYGISQPSSLKIEYKGPFSQSAYVYSARASAPAAPTTAKVATPTAQVPIARTGKQVASTARAALIKIYNVSGQWKSNINLIYNITQQQNNFQWTVTNSTEKGKGTLSGYDISASWQGPQGGGSTQGKITTVDASGKATKIIWNNGVQFYR